MIDISGDYGCVLEYTNELIGTQQVMDVVPALEDAPTKLVFATGYALPLLCPDCGELLQIEDADEFLEGIAGLCLLTSNHSWSSHLLTIGSRRSSHSCS